VLAKVEVEELKPQHISAGDVVIIPSMHPQRITNIGTEYLFFWPSVPPDLQKMPMRIWIKFWQAVRVDVCTDDDKSVNEDANNETELFNRILNT
jgi:hypothetical protein